VFQDRLIDETDRDFFKDLAMELLARKFKETKLVREELFSTDLAANRQKVTFSMILKCDYDERLYERVTDPAKLVRALEGKMIDYNFQFPQAQMSLIFFEDAIDHISRIARVLNQPAGNLMLIGSPGSGKQSLTRLGAFVHDASCATIKISKNYKVANFKEDVKEMLLDSGC
jgi:dynein heavy chain